jgi:hypothetical protein
VVCFHITWCPSWWVQRSVDIQDFDTWEGNNRGDGRERVRVKRDSFITGCSRDSTIEGAHFGKLFLTEFLIKEWAGQPFRIKEIDRISHNPGGIKTIVV